MTVIKQKLAPLLYYFGYTNCTKSKYPIIEYTEHDQKMVVEFEKFIQHNKKMIVDRPRVKSEKYLI